MSCGGKVKKAKMGTTVGKATPKGQMYGIPQTGPTGPNYQGVDTMKRGGMVKKQDGGRVIKTKRKTAVPASWRTPEGVKGDYWNNSDSLGSSETYGNTTEKKKVTGRTVLKTPYTETQPSGRTSTGTITDKFNRKGQLTKTVTRSNVTSPTGAQYKTKDINKVSTKPYKKGGSTFGMLSVKAGVDKNPKPTAADRIAGAKMKMKMRKKK
jgi:hypothetical protein